MSTKEPGIMDYAILIVDDDPAMGELLGKVLARRGYTTLVANSAPQALTLFETEQVDVVVTDLALPKIDGFELCGQLKNLQPNLPVIVMTSFGDQEQGLLAHKKGACEFLSKPLNMETLLSRIEALLPGCQRSVHPTTEPC